MLVRNPQFFLRCRQKGFHEFDGWLTGRRGLHVAELQQETRDRERHRLGCRVMIVRDFTFVLGLVRPALRTVLSTGQHSDDEDCQSSQRMVECQAALGESHEGEFIARRVHLNK